MAASSVVSFQAKPSGEQPLRSTHEVAEKVLVSNKDSEDREDHISSECGRGGHGSPDTTIEGSGRQ
jgi:hypothetical protein